MSWGAGLSEQHFTLDLLKFRKLSLTNTYKMQNPYQIHHQGTINNAPFSYFEQMEASIVNLGYLLLQTWKAVKDYPLTLHVIQLSPGRFYEDTRN